MRVIRHILLLCSLLSFSILATAEIPNLQLAKNTLQEYVSSGQYQKEMQHAVSEAQTYLKQQIAINEKANPPKKLAIVLDIDETSLSNYPDMVKSSFGGTLDELMRQEDVGADLVLPSTLEFFNYAKKNHVAIFFLTGRPEWMRSSTVNNLHAVGYKDWNDLILKGDEYKGQSAAVYKTAIRKQLTEKGYTIVINMGDQQSDLDGGYAEKNIKLPNPFYFIP